MSPLMSAKYNTVAPFKDMVCGNNKMTTKVPFKDKVCGNFWGTPLQAALKGQVQGEEWFLTRFSLKLAENDDVGETVICAL